MIDCVTWGNASLFGRALASQYRLRYRVFVEGHGWHVPHFQGMEWDQYDTPAATYLVWCDDRGEARGVVRASSTAQPYMLRDIWPDMVTEIALPNTDAVSEGTRLAVDPSLPPRLHRQVRNELVVGMIEYGLATGLQSFLHLTPVPLVKSVFLRNGFTTRMVGPARPIDGLPTVACLTEVSERALAAIRARIGQSAPVLDERGLSREVQAA